MPVRLKIEDHPQGCTPPSFMCGHLGKGIGQMGHYLIDTVGNFNQTNGLNVRPSLF